MHQQMYTANQIQTQKSITQYFCCITSAHNISYQRVVYKSISIRPPISHLWMFCYYYSQLECRYTHRPADMLGKLIYFDLAERDQ